MSLVSSKSPWLVFALTLATNVAVAAKQPDYVRRGDEVEKSYRAYTQRFEKDHALLQAALKKDAPDLYRVLNPAPPKPVAYGYQVLPKLIPDPKPGRSKEPPRATSTSYSWARCEQFIEWEIPKLEELEEKLKIMPKMSPAERRPIYERMVKDYPTLEANQRLIDNHIQYNRFWQKTVWEDKPRFDRLTLLHDAAVTRQAVMDALNAKDDQTFRERTLKIKEIDSTKKRKEVEAELRAYEKQLTKAIREQNENVTPPKFVRMNHPSAHVWQLELPIYTDIQDSKFLRTIKARVEKVWDVRDKGDHFSMRIKLTQLSTKFLYPKGGAPSPGEHLDVARHVTHFPMDGGVLTTGANSTYAIPGRFVVLGPQDINYNIIAHEFGHILGFIDGYFRGYRDRDTQGLEILEIIPDPDDIMCTPETGHVLRDHFEKMIPKEEGGEKVGPPHH